MKPTVSDSDTARPAFEVELARGGVERGEELVGRVGARAFTRALNSVDLPALV